MSESARYSLEISMYVLGILSSIVVSWFTIESTIVSIAVVVAMIGCVGIIRMLVVTSRKDDFYKHLISEGIVENTSLLSLVVQYWAPFRTLRDDIYDIENEMLEYRNESLNDISDEMHQRAVKKFAQRVQNKLTENGIQVSESQIEPLINDWLRVR